MMPHNPTPLTEPTAPHPPPSHTHANSIHPCRTIYNPYPPPHTILPAPNRTRSTTNGPRVPTNPSNPRTSTVPLPDTQPTHPNPDTHLPLLYQPVISSDPSNEPWGDTLQKDIPTHILRVLSRNVNTINLAHDFIEWQAIAHALNDYLVGVACLQETNMQWTPPLMNCVWQILHKLPTAWAAIATSNSKDITLGRKLPTGWHLHHITRKTDQPTAIHRPRFTRPRTMVVHRI